MESIRNILLAMSISNNGDWEKMYAMLKNKVYLDSEEIHKNYAKVKSNFLTITDATYPTKLKQCWHPPLCLYYYGNISLLDSNKILSVVGSRENSNYSKNAVEKIVRNVVRLDKDVIVCSGMAKGIDSIAMRAAMKENGKVISILGSGIENPYPLENKDIYEYCKTENGLILSEWPLDFEPLKENFPIRNRLIATLADTLFVGQCNVMSGTSITIKYALEFGKNICVLPQPISDEDMSNQLIKDGAEVVLNAQDLYNNLIRKN